MSRQGTATTLLALAGLLAVFWSQFAWVRATNFGGTDEWLYISLASKRVLDIPYANRPFVLLWTVPAALVWPHDLRSYYLVHTTYLSLTGWLLFLLMRRLAPARPLLGFLAAAIALTWAPLDFLRLDTVLLTGYSGFTFATLLTLVLFIESWVRDKPVLLAVAGLLGLVTARGFEGVLLLLMAAPLLLYWVGATGSRRLRVWVWSWEVLMLVIAALVVVPFLRPEGPGSYQASALRLDLDPLRAAARLLRQYGYHLLPLVRSPLRELAVPAVPLAVLTFLGLFAVVASRQRDGAEDPQERRSLALLAALGLLLATLGYAGFAFSPSILQAARTQFLASPGIGLFLAALASLGVSGLPPRWRNAVLPVLAAWVIAVGTGRTIAMQREWDEWRSAFPRQHRTLVDLTRLVPDTKPNTLVLLIDDSGAWPASFTFRHAVDYLYEGRAVGTVWKGIDFLYPAWFVPLGMYCDAWPVIRRPWGVHPTVHGYDELVVAYADTDGSVRFLQTWPAHVLPGMPPGARYDPQARIVRGTPAPASRTILGVAR